MVDTIGLGPIARKSMGVQVLSWAQFIGGEMERRQQAELACLTGAE